MIHNYVETLERYKKTGVSFLSASLRSPVSFMYSLKEDVHGLPIVMTLTSFYFFFFDKAAKLYRCRINARTCKADILNSFSREVKYIVRSTS